MESKTLKHNGYTFTIVEHVIGSKKSFVFYADSTNIRYFQPFNVRNLQVKSITNLNIFVHPFPL